LHILFPPGQAVVCPSSPVGFLALAWSWPLPHWSGQGSALTDRFLYLRSIPHVWHTHHPNDGSSEDHWNVGKLLPVYTALQPVRQASSFTVM
jgi:hypothetical protein